MRKLRRWWNARSAPCAQGSSGHARRFPWSWGRCWTRVRTGDG